MKSIACALLLLLFAVGGARADQSLLATAEHATAVGDYNLAVQSYERIAAQQGYSAPMLFNLGNAWLRLGKPARAILEYERALVLAPRDPAIEAGLEAAQQRAGIAAPAVGAWLSSARYLSFDTYAWAALVAMWVLCAAIVLLCVNGVARRAAGVLILLAAVTLCASADAAVLCWQDLYRAVMQESVSMQLAPAQSAAANGNLRAGEVVWLQGHYGGFVLVRTAEGHSGWVSAGAAVPVRASRP